jgi:hypothetical protein
LDYLPLLTLCSTYNIKNPVVPNIYQDWGRATCLVKEQLWQLSGVQGWAEFVRMQIYSEEGKNKRTQLYKLRLFLTI